MIRKALLFLAVLLALPNLAAAYNYWSITASSAPTIPGAITPPSGAGYATSGSVTNVTSPTLTTADFTVNPAPSGYVLSYVAIDGITSAPVSGSTYRVSKGTRVSHTIAAYYSAKKFTITTSKTGSGSIDPTVQVAPGSSKTISMAAAAGNRIASVAPGGALQTGGDGVTSAAYTFSNIQSDKSISVAFEPIPSLTARIATATQSVVLGSGLTVDGSTSSYNVDPSFSWSVTPAGATLTPAPDGRTALFSPSLPGNYTVTLTLSAAGAPSSSATVVLSGTTRAVQESTVCIACHQDRSPVYVADYLGSPHAATGEVSCQRCHNPAGDLAHPYERRPAQVCAGCHLDPQGGFPDHPIEIGDNPCLACHNAHSTVPMGGAPDSHYNNITSAGYPASYMTPRAKCNHCHHATDGNQAIRHAWAGSGHAAPAAPAWAGEDFKLLPGCVRCHTTTGFIAFSSARASAAWGSASDKTKELLTCQGCHKDSTTGELRGARPARPYADDPYQSRDAGSSNLCLSCHSGTASGASIAARLEAQADFDNLPFISPHYSAAGGVLQGHAGYRFPGTDGFNFYTSNSHRAIGVANQHGTGTRGPCIACHKGADNGHGFQAAAGELCAGCHGASLTPESLAGQRERFTSGLEVLKLLLADSGHPVTTDYPYVSGTSWGSGQAGADTMGAALNYLLLLREPGAYAHNAAYARRLLSSSIDYLYNGRVTGSLDGALSSLVARDKLTPEAAQGVKSYLEGGSCGSCHTSSSGSHTAHLKGFGCADCHAATAAGNTALVPGSTAHLNGSLEIQPGPGRSFSYTPGSPAGSCSAISCHGNGSATWGGTLGCDGCHGAPPATPSHLKHFGGSVAQAQYGSTAIAQDLASQTGSYLMNCGNCHPMDLAKHGNGVVEVELYNPQAPAGSLKARNPASASYTPGATLFQDDRGMAYSKGSCSNVYCHSYRSWTTPTGVPGASTCNPAPPADLVTATNYRTVAWEGPSLDCAGCHANPPRTSYPANGGGAGDSHAWLSDPLWWEGNRSAEFLHTNNMWYETGNSSPLACLYCHNDTVRQQASYRRVIDASAIYVNMSSVPIYNFSKHVNGRNDVAFERDAAVPTVSYIYGSTWSGQKLSNASYDSATRTCSNVACHMLRKDVVWGTPYKGGAAYDCERCHDAGYGGVCPDRDAALSRQPSILSTPPSLAAPGFTYSYNVIASEPGAGALSYTLAGAPEGMTVSAAGAITWTPRQDQIGDAAVRLVVGSVASGGTLVAIQDFSVTVQPPQVTITSSAPTNAYAWTLYRYDLRSTVPSGMAAPSYALTEYPSGMTVDGSGVIRWTPADTNIGTAVPVTVSASSGGYSTTQSFTLQVNPSPLVITSTPPTAAQTQVAYSYPVAASLPGQSSFSHSFITRPTGMLINTTSGVITWTPTATQVGSFPVTVQVSGGGYTNRQSFTVTVTASPITISSSPPLTAKVGTPYSYQVVASMPGGGTFTWGLPTRPTISMAINTGGLITWTPTASYTGSRNVTVSVTRGASTTTQSFTIVVSP